MAHTFDELIKAAPVGPRTFPSKLAPGRVAVITAADGARCLYSVSSPDGKSSEMCVQLSDGGMIFVSCKAWVPGDVPIPPPIPAAPSAPPVVNVQPAAPPQVTVNSPDVAVDVKVIQPQPDDVDILRNGGGNITGIRRRPKRPADEVGHGNVGTGPDNPSRLAQRAAAEAAARLR